MSKLEVKVYASLQETYSRGMRSRIRRKRVESMGWQPAPSHLVSLFLRPAPHHSVIDPQLNKPTTTNQTQRNRQKNSLTLSLLAQPSVRLSKGMKQNTVESRRLNKIRQYKSAIVGSTPERQQNSQIIVGDNDNSSWRKAEKQYQKQLLEVGNMKVKLVEDQNSDEEEQMKKSQIKVSKQSTKEEVMKELFTEDAEEVFKAAVHSLLRSGGEVKFKRRVIKDVRSDWRI